MVSIWVKVLKAIEIANKVIQARGAALDVTYKNLNIFVIESQALRNKGWEKIWNKAVTVARNIGWPESLQEETKRGRKRKKMTDEVNNEDSEDDRVKNAASDVKFKREVYYLILDNVIQDITEWFEVANELYKSSSVLWEFRILSEDEIEKQATDLVNRYSTDLQYELVDGVKMLKSIFVANFGEETLQPLQLLNALQRTNLTSLFSNLCIALRIFLTIPATLPSAERSFSALKRIKTFLRSTMCQNRLSSLGVLMWKLNLQE